MELEKNNLLALEGLQVMTSHAFGGELTIFNIEVPKLLMFCREIFDGKSNISVKY